MQISFYINIHIIFIFAKFTTRKEQGNGWRENSNLSAIFEVSWSKVFMKHEFIDEDVKNGSSPRLSCLDTWIKGFSFEKTQAV